MAGIIFFELIFPFLTSIIEMITVKIETIKAKDSLKIAKLNSKIKLIAENEELIDDKRIIGFQTEIEDYGKDFEEDDGTNENN